MIRPSEYLPTMLCNMRTSMSLLRLPIQTHLGVFPRLRLARSYDKQVPLHLYTNLTCHALITLSRLIDSLLWHQYTHLIREVISRRSFGLDLDMIF